MHDIKPNLFIAGFSKAGTTALVDYLAQHPDIFVPWEKEPHALAINNRLPSWFTTRYKMGKFKMDNYLKLYSDSANYKYRIDGSTSYTHDIRVASKIKEFNPNAKIIICIRDQKQRLVSSYLYTYLTHKENNFLKWIDKYFIPEMDSFLLYDKIVEYYKQFNTNLCIIDNKMLKNNPHHVLDLTFRFLELTPVKVELIYRNPSMISPNDSIIYRYSMFISYYVIINLLNMVKGTLLEKVTRDIVNSIRYKMAKNVIMKKAAKIHTSFIDMIPPHITTILEEDYKNTLNFAKDKGLLVGITAKM